MAKERSTKARERKTRTRATGRAEVEATTDTVIMRFDKQTQAAMKRLLRSGKITFKFADFSVTKLPAVGSMAIIGVND